MKVNLYDKKGKKTAKTVELASSVFEQEINLPLIGQAVYVYQSNQRQANAHTKTRGDVSGGGKKPWRQKGTGRARAGSSRSPIWTGGGVTFGPRNDRNFRKALTRKMRKGALRSVLSYLAKDGKIVVMEKIELGKENLAKQIELSFKNLNIGKKVLIVQKQVDKMLTKTVGNIKDLSITHVGELNAVNLMKASSVVFFDEALEDIEKFWGDNVKKETAKAKKTESKTIKPALKKAVVKKTAAKKTAAKKTAAKKTAAKKTAAKKPAGKPARTKTVKKNK